MGHNGSRKLDLVSSRGSEPLIEDILAIARTSRADSSIVLYRIWGSLHFSPIRKIGKIQLVCGLGPEPLKLQLTSLSLNHVEGDERPLTSSWTAPLHPLPRVLTP